MSRRCQALLPADEPGPNPPWERCRELATHSIAMVVGTGERSLFIWCCEDCWYELSGVARPPFFGKELHGTA